jgi:hypothetical protein
MVSKQNLNLDIFWALECIMLVYFMVFGTFYGHLVYIVVIWYIFSHFGILYREKSGNPEADLNFFREKFSKSAKGRRRLFEKNPRVNPSNKSEQMCLGGGNEFPPPPPPFPQVDSSQERKSCRKWKEHQPVNPTGKWKKSAAKGQARRGRGCGGRPVSSFVGKLNLFYFRSVKK